MYLQAVEIGVPHDLVAVNVKESHLVSPHNSQAALDLPVLCGNRLKLRAEFLSYYVAALCFLRGNLIKVISSIIGEVVHVLGFLLYSLFTAEAIPCLTEKVLYSDHRIWKREILAGKFKLAEGALMCVKHDLVEADCDN